MGSFGRFVWCRHVHFSMFHYMFIFSSIVVLFLVVFLYVDCSSLFSAHYYFVFTVLVIRGDSFCFYP